MGNKFSILQNRRKFMEMYENLWRVIELFLKSYGLASNLKLYLDNSKYIIHAILIDLK